MSRRRLLAKNLTSLSDMLKSVPSSLQSICEFLDPSRPASRVTSVLRLNIMQEVCSSLGVCSILGHGTPIDRELVNTLNDALKRHSTSVCSAPFKDIMR